MVRILCSILGLVFIAIMLGAIFKSQYTSFESTNSCAVKHPPLMVNDSRVPNEILLSMNNAESVWCWVGEKETVISGHIACVFITSWLEGVGTLEDMKAELDKQYEIRYAF